MTHLHAFKDEPARWLGHRHRVERHPWYQLYGHLWTFNDPFPENIVAVVNRIRRTEGPDVAESVQADLAHDSYDRTWDTLGRPERLSICAGHKWLHQQPAVMIDKFGVDVVSGRVLTEQPDRRLVWEDEPDLNLWWRTLKVYTEGRPVEDLLIGR